MEDWRTPKSKVKGVVKGWILKGLSSSGRIVALSKAEKRTVPCETISFFGHRIGGTGGLAIHEETRIAFHQKRLGR